MRPAKPPRPQSTVADEEVPEEEPEHGPGQLPLLPGSHVSDVMHLLLSAVAWQMSSRLLKKAINAAS